MYVPDHFREGRLDVLHAAIRRIGFGTLIVLCEDEGRRLVPTHLPMLLDAERGPCGTLRGHVARPNPVWRTALDEVPALATFLGPDAYVSPAWYPTKRETGRVVPTWNYVAVHAHGRLAFFDDAERLRALVTALTERYEAERAEPWHVTDAPEPYVAGQLKGIVGFELAIERLDGKWKLGQNRPEADRRGTIDGLRDAPDERSRAVAAAMAEALGEEPEP